MKAIDRALADAARRLGPTSGTARLDAELLMAEAFAIDREDLLLSPPQGVIPDAFGEMVERRMAGEPVAYIIGRRAFWDIELRVGAGALVPRPDSEVLISSAIAHFAGSAGPARILDLGTGPGTLLLATLDIWREATGIGVDSSSMALDYAAANARLLGIDGRCELRVGDWAAGVVERFDLVLCNPPYVRLDAKLGTGVREYEPEQALFAGDDGLASYRVIASQLARLIAPGGLAAVEIGIDQADAVAEMLVRDGLCATVANDLSGRPRAVLLKWA